MKNTFHLTSIALVLSAIAVSGCAPKQAWSPELEQAREAYQRASGNPLVTSLAITELDQAQKQLQAAEAAADYFKGRETIAHEATLAQLKALEAEQTARALQAKQSLKLAQAGTPLPQALPQTVPGTIQPFESLQPVMAAAAPEANQSMQLKETQPAAVSDSMQFSLQNNNAVSDDSTTLGSAETQQTELQKIASQLAALTDQIAQLQTKQMYSVGPFSQPDFLQPEFQQPEFQQSETQSSYELLSDESAQLDATTQPDLSPAAPSVAAVVSIDKIETRMEPVTPEPNNVLSIEPDSAEPVMAAALPAPDNNNPYEEALPSAEAPAVEADSRLRGELRSMNARPTSRGMALTLGERYFEAGSARLWNGRAARHLDNIAAVMVENPGLVIDVEAHTDNQGTKEHRNNLTKDRAIAIKSALVLRGVNGRRINTTGFGDSAPKATNDTSLGRLQNRRVEVVFPNVEGF